MRCLWGRRQHTTVGTIKAIGTALFVLFMLATAHMIISLYLLYFNTLTAPSIFSQSPMQYYQGEDAHFAIILTILWCSITVLTDILIIWRGWVLWDKPSWMIPVFALLELSLVVGVIGDTLTSLRQLSETSHSTANVAWFIGTNIVSLFTNIFASGLISFRIYQAGYHIVDINGQTRRRRKYRRLLWTYLESGSIYPTVMIISVPLYLSNSPAWRLLATVVPQISGMIPTIMILAVLLTGRSLSESTTTDQYYTDSSSYAMPTRSRRSNRVHFEAATESLPQLTIIESEPGFQVYAAKVSEVYKSTELISSHGMC